MVKRGGYILADNVNWYGKGLDKSSEVSSGKDSKTSGIVSFNRMVESSTRLESYLLDIRDGLLIVRKT